MGQSKLTYEELLTELTEVEMILNSRPLTYISPYDLDEPITPSHLITGRRLLSLPDHLCYSDDEEFRPDSSRLTVNGRLQHLSNICNHFWTRSKKEYLTELRETEGDLISVGDVVTINDDALRGLWRLGLIEEKIKGRDSHVRGALVRVKSGSGPSAFCKGQYKDSSHWRYMLRQHVICQT